MHYKMTPQEYFRKLIELYFNARKPQYYNPNIQRGRSASVASDFEDLTALFIALNNPHPCEYFVDQPLRFNNKETKYPDIVIQHESGEIKDLIDVKADIGWNRNGMHPLCKEWEERIENVKGTPTQFKQGTTKEKHTGQFSKHLTYHVLVASEENASQQLLEDHARVLADMQNVQLYILSNGIHPNCYKYTQIETLQRINIHEEEFVRFFNHLNPEKE